MAYLDMMKFRDMWLLVLGAGVSAGMGAESFEGYPAGGLTVLETPVGKWSAVAGHAEINGGHAKAGRKSLRLAGGDGREIILELREGLAKPGHLRFWAERWTSKGPFEFRVDAAGASGDFKEIWNGDGLVKVGGFDTHVEVPLEAGVSRLRIRSGTPPESGVMMDDLTVEEDKEMELVSVSAVQPVVPVLVGKELNPVMGINVITEGSLAPLVLESVEVTLDGTTRLADVEEVSLVPGGANPSGGFGEISGTAAAARCMVFSPARDLVGGENRWWVSVKLKDGADTDGRIDAAVTRLKISGKILEVDTPEGSQRIGVALRQHGDDGSKAYRIPGLARTKAGTLVAVYDVRYNHAGDLPADIDVGASRSMDGGKSWEKMAIAMDMGKGAGDGVGDPCVFVDQVSGRIWIAALWSHGNRGWHGSGPGMSPDETGQLVLVSSDDDGKSWSKPVNITQQVKHPEWRLLLAGPGTGITMKDGTLVFPAQYRAGDGIPWSTLIWSKDRGATWKIGTGVKASTTEAQLVELGDGSIMINCRDDRGGSRTVAVTKDLGAQWELHPSDRKALPESICMASLLNWDVPGTGKRLFFSNPATTSGRHTMTVKVSEDSGMSWPGHLHTVYDSRDGSGYSCLAPAGETHLGVLYEGPSEIYFMRLPVDEILGEARK